MTNTSGAQDTWWKGLHTPTNGGGSATVGRVTGAGMTGTYALSIDAVDSPDDGMGDYVGRPSAYATAGAWFWVTKAEIDATNGVLTFDTRLHTATTPDSGATTGVFFGLIIDAYDGSNDLINNYASGANYVRIYSQNSKRISTYEDDTTLNQASMTIDQTYTKSFNLKSWVQAHLASGKTWADVVFVTVAFYLDVDGYTGSDGSGTFPITGSVRIDNFV